LPLVKVKEKFQITLPVEIREQLRLGVGDLLEATIQGQTIVLKPKDVVDRAQTRQQLIEVMDRVHAKRLCRKFCSGGREEAVAPVCVGIKRPGSRTVRPQ